MIMNLVTVEQVLDSKGAQVWSVPPDERAFDALKIMAEKNVGALVVVEGEQIVGMFTERDVARKIIVEGNASRETRVRDLMTKEVLVVDPEKTLDDCMALMTAKRVRHLPVVDGGRLAGIVSIGDVVHKIISEQHVTIRDLENYISGVDYGA